MCNWGWLMTRSMSASQVQPMITANHSEGFGSFTWGWLMTRSMSSSQAHHLMTANPP